MSRRPLPHWLVPAALLALTCASGRAPGQQPDPTKPDSDKSEDRTALIKVLIPNAARLAIDDFETKATGPERRFVTPPLTPGRKFTYTLTAAWEDGGHKIRRMAIATVQAGEETVIDLRPNSRDASSSQIVYVPTPQTVVEKMLALAKVTKEDIVYDLGCGDGRVVVTAASRHGARGVGIDIDPRRVKESLANVRKAGVEKRVEIRQGDALKVPDLSRATVVMTYMLPEFMVKLKPILLEELKPGTRIVAHDYPLPGWPPQATVAVPAPTRIYAHTLYVWTVPPRKKE